MLIFVHNHFFLIQNWKVLKIVHNKTMEVPPTEPTLVKKWSMLVNECWNI